MAANNDNIKALLTKARKAGGNRAANHDNVPDPGYTETAVFNKAPYTEAMADGIVTMEQLQEAYVAGFNGRRKSARTTAAATAATPMETTIAKLPEVMFSMTVAPTPIPAGMAQEVWEVAERFQEWITEVQKGYTDKFC